MGRATRLFFVVLTLTLVASLAQARVVAAEAAEGSTGGLFVAVTPTRLLNAGGWAGGSGKMTAGQTRAVQVLGTAGVPTSGVSAVVVDIAVHGTDATTSSYLTVWASGQTRPVVSSMYYTQENAPRSNTAVVAVGPDGKINVFNYTGSTAVTVDIQGYFTSTSSAESAGGFNVMNPSRIANTAGWEYGGGVPDQRVSVGQAVDIQAEGLAGIPTSATAIFVNVEVRNATVSGTTWIGPGGSTQTWPSSMEYGVSGPYSSARAVPLDSLGRIRFRNLTGSAIDLKIDVQGYFSGTPGAGGSFTPLKPANVYSTTEVGQSDLAGNETRTVSIAGKGGIPVDGTAAAVVLTVSAKNWTAGGTVTVFPAHIQWPGTSTLAFQRDEGVPANGTSATTIVKMPGGLISIHNTSAMPVRITLTVQGWFDRGALDASASNPVVQQILAVQPEMNADEVIADIYEWMEAAQVEESVTLSFDETAEMLLDTIQRDIEAVEAEHESAQAVVEGKMDPLLAEVDPGTDGATGDEPVPVAAEPSLSETEVGAVAAAAASPGNSTEFIHLPASKRYGDIAVSPNAALRGYFRHGHAAIYASYNWIVQAPGSSRRLEYVHRLSPEGKSFVPGTKLMSVFTEEGNGPLLSYEKRIKAVNWAKSRVGDKYRGVTSPNAFRVTASVGSDAGAQNCSQLVYGAYNYANGYEFNPIQAKSRLNLFTYLQDKKFVWPAEITDAPQTKVWRNVYSESTS